MKLYSSIFKFSISSEVRRRVNPLLCVFMALTWGFPSFGGNGSSTILHVYSCSKYKLMVVSHNALEDMISYYNHALAQGRMTLITLEWDFAKVVYTTTTVSGDSLMIAKESLNDEEIQFVAEGVAVPEDCVMAF